MTSQIRIRQVKGLREAQWLHAKAPATIFDHFSSIVFSARIIQTTDSIHMREDAAQRDPFPTRLREVTTVRQYLRIVRRFPYGSDSGERFYYRGHTQADWPVRPSLSRQPTQAFDRLHAAYGMVLHGGPGSTQWEEDLIDIQTHLVERMRRLAEHHYTPKSIFHDHLEYISWLTIAQHHRLPTFLLDWSINPLVGLYFACDDAYDLKRKPDHDGCVWAIDLIPRGLRSDAERGAILHLHPSHWDAPASNYLRHERAIEQGVLATLKVVGKVSPPIVVVPRVLTNRIESQAGRFIYWSKHQDLERYSQTDQLRCWRQMKKICVVPKECKLQLLEELAELRIHAGTMGADLDGYATFLRWGGL